MAKIFISYAREDLKHAKRLYRELAGIQGLKPWLDKEELLPGMKWRPAIRKAIRESDFFIALLSKQSVLKRGYVHSEMKEAMEVLREFPEDDIFIIPVRIEECEAPDSIKRDLHIEDLFPEWNVGFGKVVNAIKSRDLLPEAGEGVSLGGYTYRCGIMDLDVGLTNLMGISEKLNSIQNFFHFTCPSYSVRGTMVENIDGIENLRTDSIPKSLYEHNEYMNVDLAVCLTKYPLAFVEGDLLEYNYFSGPSPVDERFMFVSTHELYGYTKNAGCTFEKGIVHIILGQLICYFTELGYHDETRGCVMDYCDRRADIIEGLRKSRLCSKCSGKIKNEGLKEAIEAILGDEMRV